MASIQYDFFALHIPPDRITISATTNCILSPPTDKQIKAMWDDILSGFAAGGWYQVAHILGALPYTCNALGVFAIGGPKRRHREIFHLLTPQRIKMPEAQMSVSIRFSRHKAFPHQLSIHHGMDCARVVEDEFTSPPSIHDLWDQAIQD
jgi:hypothetical protein